MRNEKTNTISIVTVKSARHFISGNCYEAYPPKACPVELGICREVEVHQMVTGLSNDFLWLITEI